MVGMHIGQTTPQIVMALGKLQQSLLEKEIGRNGGMTMLEREE